MKAFFEEWGLTIVVVIVLMVLIGVAVRSSRKGGDSMENTYNKVTEKANKFVDEAMSEADDNLKPGTPESTPSS